MLNWCVVGIGGFKGGQFGHGPPSKLAMEFGPLGGRKNNESSVNFSKCKVFDPPIDIGRGFGPLWRNVTLEGLKGLRRSFKNFVENSPPVSEVRDALVAKCTSIID